MTFDISIKPQTNMIVSGGTGSGKTTFVKNLLTIKDQLFSKSPAKTFLFYRIMQPIYNEMEMSGLIDELVDTQTNFPTYDKIKEMVEQYKTEGCIIIFDDIMTQLNDDFIDLFCNLSHHANLNIILLVQNLFCKDKVFRTLSLNSHYMVVMKNERDKNQISTLATQISPKNGSYVVQAYKEATKYPYSYLFIDYHQETPNVIRLRNNIFPHEFPTVAYLENTER